MIEHRPWIGDRYATDGFEGQRIAIVGHSHHGEPAEDIESFTVDCISAIVRGDWTHRFFSAFPTYFGCDDRRAFWPQVMFFNFLPEFVGDSDSRYGYGSDDQLHRARARMIRLFEAHRPQKAILFSTKGWAETPPGQGGAGVLGCGAPFKRVAQTTLYGLRHPQGAANAPMRVAVREILAAPV